MAIWYRAAVATRSEHDLSRLQGKLAEGIVFIPFSAQDASELREPLGIDKYAYEPKMLLLIREDVIQKSTRKEINKEYFHLINTIKVLVRIAVDPDSFIMKTVSTQKTEKDIKDTFKRNNIYSNAWPKLVDVFEQRKTTFDLFSVATVTDRSEPTYNVMNSVISLESLLLNGDKIESAYKFRVRGAYLLASSARERELMYKFLKLAYEFRSAVVHSNDASRRKLRAKFKSDFGLTIYEVNEELIKINRYILKLYLNDHGILDRLDDIVLTGIGIGGADKYSNRKVFNRVRRREKTFERLKRQNHDKTQ